MNHIPFLRQSHSHHGPGALALRDYHLSTYRHRVLYSEESWADTDKHQQYHVGPSGVMEDVATTFPGAKPQRPSHVPVDLHEA